MQLSSLYNFLLKYISLIKLLGEVRKFLGEGLRTSPQYPASDKTQTVTGGRERRMADADSESKINIFPLLFA